ncbi:MAG: methylated-DNA--[protein]-cysteine S-methyltransferase [Gemmatimonadota bacterium]
MKLANLPSRTEMIRAYQRSDTTYNGVFFTAVRTTRVFCRPSCPARKPLPKNVEFYACARDALFAGYRPCLRCRPLESSGEVPEWLRGLVNEIEENPGRRWKDQDLRDNGLSPSRVRRWFKAQHGMTFQAYQRARRLGLALGTLRHGAAQTSAAYRNGYDSLSGFRTAFRLQFDDTPGRARKEDAMLMTRLLTPLGPMVVCANDDGVYLLEFADRRMLETQMQRLVKYTGCVVVPGSHDHIQTLESELERYFAGALTEFSVPMRRPGTEFQISVWRELLDIPHGETMSYADLAVRIGRPAAVRAVARAVGDNRLAILVPCHRIIGSDGRLRGYAGGLWRKQFLLDLETGQRQAEIEPPQPAAQAAV